MAKDTQRRFLGRDQQAHERGNGGFHLFQRKETTGQTDQDRVSEDSGIKTSGLESMAEPRLEDDAETSKSTVHEAGGLERMMDDRGDEDISEEDLRLDDRFLDEEFLEDDGERNVVRRRVKKPKRTGMRPWWRSTGRHAPRARRRGLSAAAPPPSRPCWRMGG